LPEGPPGRWASAGKGEKILYSKKAYIMGGIAERGETMNGNRKGEERIPFFPKRDVGRVRGGRGASTDDRETPQEKKPG